MENIKSVTTKTTDKESGNCFTNSYIEYDQNGNETVSIDYDYDQTINAKNLTAYDAKNRRVELKIFSDEDTINETHFFEYLSDGKIMKETIVYFGDSKSVKTYEYADNRITLTTVDENGDEEEKEIFVTDSDGNVLEHIVTDYDGEQTSHQISEFENGRVVMTKSLDKHGKEINHRIFKYQDDGQISFAGVLNQKKELLDSNSYQYDEKGREILQTIGARGKITTEYDDENLTCTSTTMSSSGRIVGQTVTTFNEDGRPVREEDFSTIREFEYVYY